MTDTQMADDSRSILHFSSAQQIDAIDAILAAWRQCKMIPHYRMKVVFLAPLAVARLLVSAVIVVLGWLVIRITLLGEHPTRPLPKYKEAVSRSTLKILGRMALWACAGGKITVEASLRKQPCFCAQGPARGDCVNDVFVMMATLVFSLYLVCCSRVSEEQMRLFSMKGMLHWVQGWENFNEGQRIHAPLLFNHVS